jgi:hypothetical protein
MDTAVRWHADPPSPVNGQPTHPSPLAAVVVSGAVPVLAPGTVLEVHGVYIDLASPARGPFRALDGQVAGTGNHYVAQRDVSYELWCRLVKAAAAVAFGEEATVECDDQTGQATSSHWRAETGAPVAVPAP